MIRVEVVRMAVTLNYGNLLGHEGAVQQCHKSFEAVLMDRAGRRLNPIMAEQELAMGRDFTTEIWVSEYNTKKAMVHLGLVFEDDSKGTYFRLSCEVESVGSIDG